MMSSTYIKINIVTLFLNFVNDEGSLFVGVKSIWQRYWLNLWNHDRGVCLRPWIALRSLQTWFELVETKPRDCCMQTVSSKSSCNNALLMSTWCIGQFDERASARIIHTITVTVTGLITGLKVSL